MGSRRGQVLLPPVPVRPGVFKRQEEKEGGQGHVGRPCSPGPRQGVVAGLPRRDPSITSGLQHETGKMMLGLYALPLKSVATQLQVSHGCEIYLGKTIQYGLSPKKESLAPMSERKNLSARFPGTAGLRDSDHSAAHLGSTAPMLALLRLHVGARDAPKLLSLCVEREMFLSGKPWDRGA